jgi:hypothetical protein
MRHRRSEERGDERDDENVSTGASHWDDQARRSKIKEP